LLTHFNKSKSSRSTVIHTLALIGDQSVVDVLLKRYSSLNTNEKSVVLNMLRQFRSPQFREMAGEALLSKDSSLVSAACQGLQEDGGSQAVALLINAFEKTKNRSAWSYITNSLSALGTSEARAALVKGTQSKDTNRRSYSVNALRNLRQRSPGYQYIYKGQQLDRQKKWKEAIQQYTIAAQIDPDLPEAYTGRGNALLRQEKFKEAAEDLEKALKLDPFSSMALTGLAIVRVMQDKTDEGIKLVESKRKMFENDAMYAYNVACVYGRALEVVQKNMKAKDRDKRIAQYQKKALDDLKRSMVLGFRDKNWMKEDPDLKSLHELDGFKKLLSSDPADLRARGAGQPRPGVQIQQAAGAFPFGIP
jgi:tetratricopeptide (TPR) repeat protein